MVSDRFAGKAWSMSATSSGGRRSSTFANTSLETKLANLAASTGSSSFEKAAISSNSSNDKISNFSSLEISAKALA